MSSWFQHLLRIARAVVEQVINQVTAQINVVEDQVRQVLQGFVQQVLGGVWQGRGADEFVNEISSVAMPRLTQLIGSITMINTNVRTAVQIMDDADTRARAKIDQLQSTFDRI